MSRVRHVHGGTEKHTEIATMGKRDRKSHAYHHYDIYRKGNDQDRFAAIFFQQGLIKEAGVNGCSNEDLLAIVVDRLECLQAGKFPCDENVKALQHVKLALTCLNDRTFNREKRGVEGLNKA